MKTLGSRRHAALVSLIIQAREKAGLSQQVVADALGEQQSLVARLESGQRRIDVVEYLRIADAIGFDPVALLKRIRAVRD